MALWQFVTFSVLIVTLLVYVGLITHRLGRTVAGLTRIDEALLAVGRSVDSAVARAAEAASEISAERESRPASYLTIRDLRAKSEQLSTHTARSGTPSPVAVSEKREAPKTTRGQKKSPGAMPEDGSPLPLSSEAHEGLQGRSEPLSSRRRTRPLKVKVKTGSESRDLPDTNGGATALPTVRLSGDPAATSLEVSGVSEMGREALALPTMHVSGRSVKTSLEDHDAPPVSSESLQLPTMRLSRDDVADPSTLPVESEDSAVMSAQGNDAENRGQQSPPSYDPPDDDIAARKEQEAAAQYLRNQRRRRRMRVGY